MIPNAILARNYESKFILVSPLVHGNVLMTCTTAMVAIIIAIRAGITIIKNNQIHKCIKLVIVG